MSGEENGGREEGHGLDYRRLMREALLGLVARALRHAAARGFAEGHHFYIGFRTTAPGVILPTALRRQYPEEMTVVLQHQFWDLEVDAEAFAVTLLFGGARHRLTVPFEAITRFADPGAPFALRFEDNVDLIDDGKPVAPRRRSGRTEPGGAKKAPPIPSPGGGQVIPFDPQRRP